MQNMNKQYFMDLMATRKLSMRGLAQKMGLQHSQLSLMFSGQRKMALDEAAQLSHIFGVPLHEIVAATGVKVRPASGRRASVIGFVGKDGTVTMNSKETIERTDAPPNLPDDAVAIQFRTTDSPLAWADGWVCFCARSSGISPDSIGRFSLCKIKGGPVVIATPRRGYREGSHNLTGTYQQENVVLEAASPLLIGRF